MPETLYHVPRTISSPIVQILLELEAVDNPVIVKELSFPDLKSDQHLAINPMGTSPAFLDTDMGITMWESGAVLDYLLERYDAQKQFFPAFASDATLTSEQIRARSKYLQLKQYIIATVYPFIASMYIHSLKPEHEIDAEYMEAAKKKCRTVLEPVLTTWLGEGPYFLGDRISAVDFLAAKPLSNLNSMGMLQDFPELEALFERVSSRSTFKQAYEGGMRGPNDQTIIMIPKKDAASSQHDAEANYRSNKE